MVRGRVIYVSDRDVTRLKDCLNDGRSRYGDMLGRYAQSLHAELKRARVVPEHLLPADVVALDSSVRVSDLDTEGAMAFRLTLPDDANGADRVSVLSPLGMAVFGYRVGDRLDWGPVERLIRLRIDAVSRRRRRARH